jgi:hypothetical protein
MKKSGNPQFISTDRHVLQGAIEIENVSWNENEKTISGISTGPLNTSHSVFVYVPRDIRGHGVVRDFSRIMIRIV